MKLLASEVGWTATRTHLFWTMDNGKGWKDITPAATAENGAAIVAVFFLNASTGWVLFANRDSDGRAKFDLASTTDSGTNWAITRVRTSGLTPPEATLSGNGHMFFLDANHGWINLAVASGSAFHSGAALATQDGGKTWNWVPRGSGSAGPILFTSLKDGWILSPDHTELDVTHDGSQSWQTVTLYAAALPQAGTGEPISYDLPRFENATHGFLAAGFGGSDRMTLFDTTDGGITWRPKRVLPHLEESGITISDSNWIAVSAPLHGHSLTLTKISLNESSGIPVAASAKLDWVAGLHGVDSVDFADGSHGWVLAGELLATVDGGVTWSDVTPPRGEARRGVRSNVRTYVQRRKAPQGSLEVARN